MRFSMLMWAALTVVVGISLFLLKYQVQELEDQLQATYTQIEKDKSAIRVLHAEWTYLNDPARLRRLSEQHQTRSKWRPWRNCPTAMDAPPSPKARQRQCRPQARRRKPSV